MKGAPNFRVWPDPVDGRWKIELLRWLRRETGIKVLVETGTCQGVTPYELRDEFEEIHTMELHPGLYEESRQRLSPYGHIHLYHGSSRTLLRELLSNDKVPPGPVLFWLDAHTSGPHTANDGDPLPDEMAAITQLEPEALVVVDDMMGLDNFLGQVSSVDLRNWNVEYRTGEILAHYRGMYNIPQFEA